MLAVGAGLVPGVLVHGAGHWVICERETALTLLYLESAGVASTVVSLTGLAVTGASPYFVAPLALGAIGGLGLFASTWFADLYGIAAPPGGTGTPRARLPRLLIQSGIRAVYDPLFDNPWLLSQSFTLNTGAFWISPRLDAATNAQHRRYSLLVGRRLAGAHTDRTRHAPWTVDAAFGIRDFVQKDEGFGSSVAELSVGGRLDFALLGSTLSGSFGFASAGYAREWHRFDGLPGYAWDQLLARFGFGAYLGSGSLLRGETFFAYDHRRDTLSGGLRLPGVPAGYLGFIEQRTELFFGPSFGAALELGYGSAFVASAYLLVKLAEEAP